MGEETWVRVWNRPPEFVEDRDGVSWIDAPIPPPDHTCVVQTRAIVLVWPLPQVAVRRCACGATNLGAGWHDRNTRTESPPDAE